MGCGASEPTVAQNNNRQAPHSYPTQQRGNYTTNYNNNNNNVRYNTFNPINQGYNTSHQSNRQTFKLYPTIPAGTDEQYDYYNRPEPNQIKQSVPQPQQPVVTPVVDYQPRVQVIPTAPPLVMSS